jgi:hypothetical protein
MARTSGITAGRTAAWRLTNVGHLDMRTWHNVLIRASNFLGDRRRGVTSHYQETMGELECELHPEL